MYQERFNHVVSDDLNTAQALAVAWELARAEDVSSADKRTTLLDFDRVLGLKLDQHTEIEVPEDIQTLVHTREMARREKNWSLSDELRQQIEAKGFAIKDTPTGPQISKL
jgi:cysteinyl-tRNA synthetase